MPCLYYGFYCSFYSKIVYIFATLVLCAASLIVSFFDKFSESHYRPVRAGVFTAFALSSVIPAVHWYVTHGGVAHLGTTFQSAVFFILLMATLYITGVLFYALRIPERFYPGKYYYVSFVLFCCLFYQVTFYNLNNSFTRTPCFTYLSLLLPFLICVVLPQWLILVSSRSKNIFLNASFKVVTREISIWKPRQLYSNCDAKAKKHTQPKWTTFIIIASF